MISQPKPGISIIIPSYNGIELLKRCIPLVIDVCAAYSGPTEILVIDDGGTDATPDEIPYLFPGVSILRKPLNRGFAITANFGILSSEMPYILLLNNDIEISPDLLNELAPQLNDNLDVFAVQPRILNSSEDESYCLDLVLKQSYGIFYYTYLRKECRRLPYPVDFVSGGCALFRKSHLVTLNYFDERFSPVYFEDMDLCFRARQFGFRLLCVPTAKVWHRHPASTVRKKFSWFHRNVILRKNYFLFNFKHIASFDYYPLCFLALPLYAIYKLFRGNCWYLLGLFASLLSVLTEMGKRTRTPSNIVVYGDTPLLPFGGGQISLINLFKNLSSYVPVIISSYNSPPSSSPWPRGYASIVTRTTYTTIFTSFIRCIYYLSIIRAAIVHCNSGTTLFTITLAVASFVLRIPFVWHMGVIETAGWRDLLIGTLASKIIVNSDAVKAKYEKFPFVSRVIRIYNGVDNDIFKSGYPVEKYYEEFNISHDAVVIGVFSRLDSWKGHTLFFAAWDSLGISKLSVPVYFLIVGEGPCRNKLEEIVIRSHALAQRTVFAGFRDDIPALMNFCSIIVNPSSLPEPFGRTVIEAMSCMKPVIAIALGGHKEIIEHNSDGLLVEPDPKELATAMLALINNKILRENISVAARLKAVKQFSVKKHTDEVEAVYNEILSSKTKLFKRN